MTLKTTVALKLNSSKIPISGVLQVRVVVEQWAGALENVASIPVVTLTFFRLKTLCLQNSKSQKLCISIVHALCTRGSHSTILCTTIFIHDKNFD